MDNYALADQILLLSKLMDIHGENAFKSKSYASAAFAIEKAPQEIATLPSEKVFSIKGVGESVSNKIIELLKNGELKVTQDYLAKTPEGVLDMLHIKGLGPKKIHTIWKELGIDTVENLASACKKGELAAVKGFGEKTEEKILEAILFDRNNRGTYLYAQVEEFAASFTATLKEELGEDLLQLTGAFRRQLEVIEKLEWITTTPKSKLKEFATDSGMLFLSETGTSLLFSVENKPALQFHLADKDTFYSTLFSTSCSEEFLKEWDTLYNSSADNTYKNEEDIFKPAGLPFIPSFLRERKEVITEAKKGNLPDVIQPGDVKGLIHAHSNWSDGATTIDEMANELIRLGFEYLVLSDHSKAAFYAGGLTEQKIKEQHASIDALNKKLAPFKIYKSIECDILSDGALDYDDAVLATFDLVIASIHSNLQMTEEKAMKRLLGAIENPYITILGHMTGRRLLKRAAYPVNHQAVIDACAEHGVVIEINAHPERLDMQWQWIHYALQKGVLLSVNPDAHSLDGFGNIKYGVLAAQKGGLTKESNVSSMSRIQFEEFLERRKKEKGL